MSKVFLEMVFDIINDNWYIFILFLPQVWSHIKCLIEVILEFKLILETLLKLSAKA